MNHNIFPEAIHLDDARAAVKDCAEFFEKEQEDLIVFNYKYCNARTFPNPEDAPDDRTKLLWKIKRECRGLIFNKISGKVVARRYHKFFNIGELPETQPDKLDLSRPYIVLTKYDGVLVTPVFTNGAIRFASKSGFADVTLVIEDRFLSDPANQRYVSFSRLWMERDCTPIFEWCSPRNKIVLTYDQDLLVLTGIRHNTTGTYVNHNEVQISAKLHTIHVTEGHEGVVNGIEAFLQHLQAKENIEGVVIKFEDNGAMFKIKTNWYFSRTHKDKQDFSINSERHVWRLILDQEIDDALAHLNDSVFSANARVFEKELYDAMERLSVTLSKIAGQYRHLGRREFYEAIQKDALVPPNSHKILLRLYDAHKDAIDLIIEEIKANCKSAQLLEKNREMLGGTLRFKETPQQIIDD